MTDLTSQLRHHSRAGDRQVKTRRSRSIPGPGTYMFDVVLRLRPPSSSASPPVAVAVLPRRRVHDSPTDAAHVSSSNDTLPDQVVAM